MEYLKLKEVADIYLGLTHTPKYVESGIPFLSVKDISGGNIDFSNCHYITEDEYKSLPKGAKPERGDMLFCRVGTIGKPIIIEDDIQKFGSFVSLGFLRRKNNNILPEYLKYWMNSNLFYKQVKQNVKGVAQVNLNTTWLKEFDIPKMSIDEQKNIVDKLSKIERLIQIKNIEIKKLNQLIKSQFVDMFGCKQDGFKCNTIQFSECVSSMLKGPFGSDIKKSLYVSKAEDTYKVYIQVNAIQKNENLGDYYISKEYFDSKMHKFEVKPFDYIVTCDGTLGKLLRLDNDMEKGIISASLLKITLNEKISYKYFEEVWNQYMLGELSKDIRNACLTHLPSAKVIGSLYIPLPSKKLQDKYTKIVEQIDKQKFVGTKIARLLGKIAILC